MTTINFQELRRRERQRIRSTKTVDSSRAIANNDSAPSVAVNDESQPQQQNVCALTPFETLLPQNKLSEDIHQIQSAANIDSVFYAKQFLAPKMLDDAMTWLQTIPDYSQTSASNRTITGLTEEEMSLQHNGKWTRLKHARRKVALFDGTLSSYELPPILQRISNTLVSIGAFPSTNPPNHVLVNEYQPGEGIMPHTDGPAYDSCTATISLGGSDVIFKLRPRQHFTAHEHCDQARNVQQKLDLILHGNGSLIVFRDDAYLEHTHEISEGVFEETTESGTCGNDLSGGTIVKRGYRISLTFRCKKVKKSTKVMEVI
ncbi:alpha-ketoglutarate-dependent dioxygenase alkB family protein [Skeletonema marinoi]|uniref:Alpha-ketoglutarate-dependent dioxygenase alkB family protein n=1 Tax=Skeletonema marinoi TaxID=267567 RepID=A0AAD8YEQ1_9STRA|nr:alpha-ketoglutarate-dependent dioxygenase alkB family protein [Skeletonema marinoi]